jgi:hypothetical protein
VGDDPTPDVAPAEAAVSDDRAPDDEAGLGEDEAQKRRAAFKVIDGGD